MSDGTEATAADLSADNRSYKWSDLGLEAFIKAAVIGALLWFFFHVEISRVVYKWRDPSWSHGILIPFFSLYFLHQNRDDILSLRPKVNYLGLFFLILFLLAYPLTIAQFKIGYARPLLLIASIGAVVLFLGGWGLVKYTWLPIAYLVFAVPLPERIYKQITFPMRMWAADVATFLLGLVPHLEATANGVVIDVVYKGQPLEPALNVAEACSGMRLLMAFVALGVAMAYLHYRPVWQRLVLLASTVPIAILCNIIRVTTTGFIYILGDPKYAQGIYHDGLGLLMLPLAFGIYGGLAWFMNNLFEEVDEHEQEDEHVIIRRKDSGE